jgi:hypothetical protein
MQEEKTNGVLMYNFVYNFYNFYNFTISHFSLFFRLEQHNEKYNTYNFIYNLSHKDNLIL